MRWLKGIGLWLLLFSPGCTHLYPLMPGVYDAAHYRAKALALCHAATIQLKAGPRFVTRILHVRNDSLITAWGAYALTEVQ